MFKYFSRHVVAIVALGALANAADKIDPSFVPAVYLLESLPVTKQPKMAGGEGELVTQFAFTRDKAPKDFSTKEMAYRTLMPGHSVGIHKHEGNEDSYLIVSGEGIYTDENGVESVVKAGDMTICRSGHSHGIRNEGKEPLVFFTVLSAQ